jgi:hypothetical protein
MVMIPKRAEMGTDWQAKGWRFERTIINDDRRYGEVRRKAREKGERIGGSGCNHIKDFTTYFIDIYTIPQTP